MTKQQSDKASLGPIGRPIPGPYRVPEYDAAKRGRILVVIEQCYDADHPVGFVQVTPMTMGDLPMAHQIAALPELYAVCEEIAAEPYLDSDLDSLLETLGARAKSALRLVNKPIAAKRIKEEGN